MNTTNYATNTKWLASIPFRTLFPNESEVHLNLTAFDIPSIDIGTTSISYGGYSIEQPSNVIQPSDKECTFSYILDSNMTVYWLLYKWCSMFSENMVSIIKEDEESSGSTVPLVNKVPISVFILNEFKTKIMKITYHDCWVKSFGNLSMSYQDDPAPLTHTFTVAYSRFEIERV